MHGQSRWSFRREDFEGRGYDPLQRAPRPTLPWGIDVGGFRLTNRILLTLLLGVELNDYRRRFDQDWANLTVLRWPDRVSGARLLLANDQSHSRGIRGITWG